MSAGGPAEFNMPAAGDQHLQQPLQGVLGVRSTSSSLGLGSATFDDLLSELLLPQHAPPDGSELELSISPQHAGGGQPSLPPPLSQQQHSTDDSSSLSQGDSCGRPPRVSPELRSRGGGDSHAATPFAVPNPVMRMRIAGRPGIAPELDQQHLYQHQHQHHHHHQHQHHHQQQQQQQHPLPPPPQPQHQQPPQPQQHDALLTPLQIQYQKRAIAQHPHLAALQGGMTDHGSGALSDISVATHASHASAPAAMYGDGFGGALPASEPLLQPEQHYEALHRRSHSFSQGVPAPLHLNRMSSSQEQSLRAFSTDPEGHRRRTSFVTLSDVQPRTPLSRADSPFTAQLKALPGLQEDPVMRRNSLRQDSGQYSSLQRGHMPPPPQQGAPLMTPQQAYEQHQAQHQRQAQQQAQQQQPQQLLGALPPPHGPTSPPTLRRGSGDGGPQSAWQQHQHQHQQQRLLQGMLPNGQHYGPRHDAAAAAAMLDPSGGAHYVPIVPMAAASVQNPFAAAAQRGPPPQWQQQQEAAAAAAAGQDQLGELPGVRSWSASARIQTPSAGGTPGSGPPPLPHSHSGGAGLGGRRGSHGPGLSNLGRAAMALSPERDLSPLGGRASPGTSGDGGPAVARSNPHQQQSGQAQAALQHQHQHQQELHVLHGALEAMDEDEDALQQPDIAGPLQRVRSFRSTSAGAAGGLAGVRKLSRSFDRRRVETIAQLSGHEEEEEAAAGVVEQLAAADLRRESLEKRNALLEGFIGLDPPQAQRAVHRPSVSATPGAGAGVSVSLGAQLQAANPFARASAPARAISGGGGSPPAAGGGGGGGGSRMPSLPPDVRSRLEEDAAQQDALRMDDPEAEQPLGFRRASAGAHLPTGVQAVGMEVLNPAVAPGQEWWLDAEAARAAAAFPLGTPGGPPCSGALTFTLRPGAPIHLTREQVAALPWRDVCGLWKDYTTAVADCLAAAAGDAGAAAGRRLTRLLFEAGLLRDAVSQHRDRPRVACAAVCFVPDPAVVPPPPPPERWREVSASLLLTPATAQHLARLRRCFLQTVGSMQRRRREAFSSLATVGAVAEGSGEASGCFEATLGALAALREGFTEERSLLRQYKAITWGRVLSPMQAALATVQSYPYTVDVPALVEAAALELGEPLAAVLLAGTG